MEMRKEEATVTVRLKDETVRSIVLIYVGASVRNIELGKGEIVNLALASKLSRVYQEEYEDNAQINLKELYLVGEAYLMGNAKGFLYNKKGILRENLRGSGTASMMSEWVNCVCVMKDFKDLKYQELLTLANGTMDSNYDIFLKIFEKADASVKD